MRIVALIQARMDSKRLPGKVLMDLNGMPTIKHIYRRLLKCRQVDEVCISWGCTCEKDEKVGCLPCIAKVTEAFGFMPRIWTGSEHNLVARHLGAAYAMRADAIVRITGDCPLVDPMLVDQAVEQYRANYPRAQVLTNSFPKAWWPDGLDLDIQSIEVLQRIAADKDFPKEEYIGPMLKCGWFTWDVMPYPSEDLSGLRITLDYPSDHEAMTAILKKIGNDCWDWTKIPADLIPQSKRPNYLDRVGYVEKK